MTNALHVSDLGSVRQRQNGLIDCLFYVDAPALSEHRTVVTFELSTL